jgi:hypothetical protein
MKGEMLDNYMERYDIYNILPGNLSFKEADLVGVFSSVLAIHGIRVPPTSGIKVCP